MYKVTNRSDHRGETKEQIKRLLATNVHTILKSKTHNTCVENSDPKKSEGNESGYEEVIANRNKV